MRWSMLKVEKSDSVTIKHLKITKSWYVYAKLDIMRSQKKTFKKTLNEFFIEFGMNLSGNIRLMVTC